MAWRRIFYDDFSSYASYAVVSAAYAAPSDYDAAAADWGATYGPDGQPGIKDQVTSPARDTGTIEKVGLTPAGRGFRVIGRWNDAATNHILTAHSFLILRHEGQSSSVQLNRIHASQALSITIKTIAPFGNTSGGLTQFDTVAGVLTTNIPKTVELNGHLSTKTEVSPGVFAPNNDGDAHILIDGVEIYSWSGPIWDGDDSVNLSPPWNDIELTTIGAFTNFDVYDEPVKTDTGGGESLNTPCCHTSTTPATADTGGNPNPVGDFPPFVATCVGKGQVDSVLSLSEGEVW